MMRKLILFAAVGVVAACGSAATDSGSPDSGTGMLFAWLLVISRSLWSLAAGSGRRDSSQSFQLIQRSVVGCFQLCSNRVFALRRARITGRLDLFPELRAFDTRSRPASK